jgi:hypothetical protein
MAGTKPGHDENGISGATLRVVICGGGGDDDRIGGLRFRS